ncbi:MAG TPA: hypothetical protein VGP44_01550 [Gemmatimonadales bacterium]|nr:hypothetical protein [Gemmatimonadales bacterium]
MLLLVNGTSVGAAVIIGVLKNSVYWGFGSLIAMGMAVFLIAVFFGLFVGGVTAIRDTARLVNAERHSNRQRLLARLRGKPPL